MRTFRFLSDNLDETVFEHRNKAYGAYELRKSYHARVIKSFFFSLSFIALLFGVPVIIQSLFKKPMVVPKDFTITMVELSKKPEAEPKKNISIAPAAETPKQSLKTDAPLLVMKDSLLAKDENKKDTALEITVTTTLSNNKSQDTTGSDTKGTILVKTNPGNEAISASLEPMGLAAVDKVPQFPGGDPSMMRFLEKNIHYKEQAKIAGVTGRVYASFIINSKGQVEGIKIIRSLGFGLDEEVARVLSIMPKWEPGYFRGQAVSTIMNIPVSFSLVK